MARLTPESYHPHLSFRFKIVFSSLENIGFYGKSINLPKAENNPLTIEYGNTYVKVKGKTRWNDITFTCYTFENMTHQELWAYLNELHQSVDMGEDIYADNYKKMVLIQMLSPRNRVVGRWKLIGAFISSIDFGDLDWTTEEVVQPQITLSYDYALYESEVAETTE